MDGVAAGGLTADTVEMLLAWIFLGGYVLALGRLVGRRGRLVAAIAAAAAAGVFIVRSSSWEAGVVMVALVPLGVGLFAGSAWIAWRLTGARGAMADSAPAPEAALPNRRARGRLSTWLQRV